MPKTYYNYMSELTADQVYEGLLAHGLFNDKLPPFLSSKPFYDYCQQHTPSFNMTQEARPFIYYENMRNINIPRPLGIPNPILYQKLCFNIKENWNNILNHFRNTTSNQDYKKSRIHIRKLKDNRNIFEMNYKNHKIDKPPEPELLIGNRYLVKADIATCFHSIYTHSLSWALVGKETAKDNKSDDSKWYNKLDFHTRNTTNGETHGLLIGPTTSNLLSEIILTSIDFELSKKDWKYVRNIDDYTAYVSSYEEGQEFLNDLSVNLRNYKLMLNHQKTQISPLPLASTEHWVRKLNTYLIFHNDKSINYKEINAFMDLTIQLMSNNNMNSAIINYAIKLLSVKELTPNARDYFIKTLFHLAIIYPYILTLLQEYVFEKFEVTNRRIKEFSNLIYKEGFRFNNYEAVSYALYYSLHYDFEIDHIHFQSIRDSNHCIAMLLASLYAKKYNINSEFNKFKRHARKIDNYPDEFNQYWLFVYEVLPKHHISGDWKKLKEKNVTFIKYEELSLDPIYMYT
ncbi:RNA-directed DNA polymerase [Halobacillus sp. GSS1]|uniref:RNA-directed DNA polymerase n=1 Tax=Halobacillus sp. GSS1 TaxID=2815919 RepID=UPI001A8D2CEE|nr:RNA-directed DNA polymerase [Halobacillus sp. GSS1]MBN9653873.1 RNA-directed DNA polymerase [Halobacillus sp. GSS1]